VKTHITIDDFAPEGGGEPPWLPPLQKISKICTNVRFQEAIQMARASQRGEIVSISLPMEEGDEFQFKTIIWNGVLSLCGFTIQDMANLYEGLGGLCDTLIKIKLRATRLLSITGGELPNLQFLDLAQNRISKIEDLKAAPRLRVLNLGHNQIETVEGLDHLPQLRQLDLSHNKIREIKGLDRLPNLHSLYLSHNQISNLNGLDTLPQLLELHLYDNNIKSIQGLDNLPNLETLYLDENRIEDLQGLEHLPRLRTLGLSRNCIKEIKGLDRLPALENL
jgi:protein phosphatase 1 regulatory subunit 7